MNMDDYLPDVVPPEPPEGYDVEIRMEAAPGYTASDHGPGPLTNRLRNAIMTGFGRWLDDRRRQRSRSGASPPDMPPGKYTIYCGYRCRSAHNHRMNVIVRIPNNGKSAESDSLAGMTIDGFQWC